ncbi:thiamine phosphate synthase [Fictibacillus nanhaiensis]|uniref:thiamine phosphate synthase n=1 Tax=Fictibacillus nanhaiensis TaxID=742169 RepID=UPI001C979911|nr:thiamine phosphate synthase [Fictibacillus nanhaiensis]MBY6036510.1 thiamine phosphate synthase [Fictibacillus nanhaiensis]
MNIASEESLVNARSRTCLAQTLSLYYVAGTTNCESPESFMEILIQACKGGITTFQFREKGTNCLNSRQRIQIAEAAKNVCRQYGVLFIVNDDLALMKELDADGLHVGQTDGSLDVFRRETKGKILGVSTHTLLEAEDAVTRGADYVGVGPIFQTYTKPDAKEPVGTGIFSLFRENNIMVPMVGIGGITKDNAASVVKGGADGVALISAISEAEHPLETSRELLRTILQAKKKL